MDIAKALVAAVQLRTALTRACQSDGADSASVDDARRLAESVVGYLALDTASTEPVTLQLDGQLPVRDDETPAATE